MASIQKKINNSGIVYRVKYWGGRKNSLGKRLYDYSGWMKKRKEAEAFRESLSQKKRIKKTDFLHVNQAIEHMLEISGSIGRNGKEAVQSSTVEYYRNITNKARLYNWSKPLPELDHEEAKEFRDWLLKSYSRDMARRVLSSVSSAVTEAIGHKNNPFVGITISRPEKEPVAIPDRGDVRALLQAADRLLNSKNIWIAKTWERYFPMINLMYATGMRSQEYVAFPDLGLFQNQVKVLQALKKTGMIGKPKTKKGLRTIPVDEAFLEPTHWYFENKWVDNKHRLIFPTSNQTVQSPDNFRSRCWKPLMKEAGLGHEVLKSNGKYQFVPKFTPHAMRHFFASMQIANDKANSRLSAKRIQDLMGHASIEMTFDVYGHLLEDEDSKTNDAIRNAMKI